MEDSGAETMSGGLAAPVAPSRRDTSATDEPAERERLKKRLREIQYAEMGCDSYGVSLVRLKTGTLHVYCSAGWRDRP